MEKVLTIVVPTYNMEAYLDRCLTSLIVKEPLMDKLEVIVVNDGSKDRSSEIAHGYESRYPDTFHVIDKENGNYGSCVNRGLEEATSKYFRILDADDWADTQDLTLFIEYLDTIDIDVVFTNHTIIYEGREKPSTFPMELDCNAFNIDEFDFRKYDLSWFVLMHRMTYRLQLLKECKLHHHEGISYTDTDYCFYPCISAKTLGFKNLAVYNYNCCREGQTMSANARARSLSHMTTILNDMFNAYFKVNGTLSSNRKHLLWESFGNITHSIYQTLLIDSKKSKENDQLLTDIDNLLKKEPGLFDRVADFEFNGLPSVKIWRSFGLYNTSFILRVYNHFYRNIEAFKNKLR